MTYPLPPTVHGDTNMELYFTHFEGSSVLMTHEIANQPLVLVDLPSSSTVGHSSGLHDGMIAAHVVHDPDEPVVYNVERNTKYFIQFGNGRAVKMLCFNLLWYFGFFGHGIPIVLRCF